MSFGTFKHNDVTLLLKDITGMVEPQPTSVREPLIQSGRHYCEMLPPEYRPSDEYLAAFWDALDRYAPQTASSVANVSKAIFERKGRRVVLVSLARAGIPAGILIKHYLSQFMGVNPPHYAISIIRGKGIDKNAVARILSEHQSEDIQFVDGWTGKGAIKRELDSAVTEWPGLSSSLAVLSDPARISSICGTHDDFLIPSSCLNSTVSGLLSRTFLRDDIIGEKDYHGAAFYEELRNEDLTYTFIDRVEGFFAGGESIEGCRDESSPASGLDEVRHIAEAFSIPDINLIKPGIGETTRVLLRRTPWKILVNSLDDNKNLGHIYQLAKEKNVEVVTYPLVNYRACGLIRRMADC